MSSRIVRWILCACSVAVSSGCGAGLSPSKKAETVEEQRGADGRPAPLDRAASSKEVSQSDRSKPADEIDRRLQDEVIGRVALVRQLAWKRRPTTMRVSRQEAYRRIIAMNERNVPPRVLDATGEMLRALGLIGPKLDWKKTMYALARANLAGFYDPYDKKMFVLDDLSLSLARETLTHELVHALQDQHFDLGRRLKYAPGKNDAVSAIHGLCEGEATAATFGITQPGVRVSPSALRLALMASVALSEAGGDTPRVLQAALVTSYIDGYRFVDELLSRGGWEAVDDAWKRPPQTTEQLLHLDKYKAREPAIALPPVPSSVWREDDEVMDSDSMGEQGLRLVAEQWTHVRDASRAAAGWGGDRYTVVRRRSSRRASFVLAWQLVFDTERDAEEFRKVVETKFGTGCTRQGPSGAIGWRAKGKAMAVVAGLRSLKCEEVERKLRLVLSGMPTGAARQFVK